MRRVKQLLPAVILVVFATLSLSGCHGSSEAQYVNQKNPKETLTMKQATNVKTQIIRTFHGISNGSYTLKTETGTSSGTFAGDGASFKFRPEDGEAESVKIKSDGSFDYADRTWNINSQKWDLNTNNGKVVKKLEKTWGSGQ